MSAKLNVRSKTTGEWIPAHIREFMVPRDHPDGEPKAVVDFYLLVGEKNVRCQKVLALTSSKLCGLNLPKGSWKWSRGLDDPGDLVRIHVHSGDIIELQLQIGQTNVLTRESRGRNIHGKDILLLQDGDVLLSANNISLENLPEQQANDVWNSMTQEGCCLELRLRRIDEKEAIKDGRKAFHELDSQDRCAFLNALSAAVPALTLALQDKECDVRFSATQALCTFCQSIGSAISPLRDVLRDSSADTRCRCASADALGELPASKEVAPTVSVLISTLLDCNLSIRLRIIGALLKLSWHEDSVKSKLEAAMSGRSIAPNLHVSEEIASIGSMLASVIRDGNGDTCLCVVEALCEYCQHNSTILALALSEPALVSTLRSCDHDFRLCAIEALLMPSRSEDSGIPEFEVAMRDRSASPDKVLASIASKKAVLIKLMTPIPRDKDEHTRSKAVKALNELCQYNSAMSAAKAIEAIEVKTKELVFTLLRLSKSGSEDHFLSQQEKRNEERLSLRTSPQEARETRPKSLEEPNAEISEGTKNLHSLKKSLL